MFAHEYVTFVLIDNSTEPEPRGVTINTKMLASMGWGQQKKYSELYNQYAHVMTWVLEFTSGSTLTVTLECPFIDTDEQGNEIDIDTDMAYDSFQEAKKRSTIEVTSVVWE